MTTQPIEHSEQLKKCSEILKAMLTEAVETSPDSFPDKKTLHSSMPTQLAIIAEQAKKLAELQPGSKIFGLDYLEEDHLVLMKKFLSDLVQFTTLHKIDLGFKIYSFGQTRIIDHAFYHLAVSPLLPATYSSITQNGGRVFDIYSIPFKIRAALELKLSCIIGFERCEIIRNGKTLRFSTDLPFSDLLKDLHALDCLNTPCSLANMKNIYQWACNFCHTGEKEYLWLCMKALEIISPLFTREGQVKAEMFLYERWRSEGLSNEELNERTVNLKGPLRRLHYFREGWSVQVLQDALNKMEEERGLAAPKRTTKKYHLSESYLAELADCYCDRTKKYY
ncbi:hypothetical protein [Citrobacter braakii]|uniref:hypothetical protein n=1 Tax=Citrobacter braakii TaxID=57706 RepID=UPI001FFFD379|nr:hypothetical protein [Citrobacter braakii]MCK2155665.1 hypothetical protein [Citrobacter braakii]